MASSAPRSTTNKEEKPVFDAGFEFWFSACFKDIPRKERPLDRKRPVLYMSQLFRPANILIPDLEDLSAWSVVACDQFTSNPEYWQTVREKTAGQPTALNLILPEAWLSRPEAETHQSLIDASMEKYLQENLFKEYPDSFIYVERTMLNGTIRRGLVGMTDLEAYDYKGKIKSPIRATEATIVERIPPRRAIRQKAPLEIPHILLLCDDAQDFLFGRLEQDKDQYPIVYDFDLMADGGHITGRLVQGAAADAFSGRLALFSQTVSQRYPDLDEDSLVFAVGDGNHSLATARSIWEDVRQTLTEEEKAKHPARFALAELENIHDASQQFEPIHRVLCQVDSKPLLEALQNFCTSDPSQGYPIQWVCCGDEGTLYLDKQYGGLAVSVLQSFLDDYLQTHSAGIDYIHGEEELRSLIDGPDKLGFLLPAISKCDLFRGIIQDGSLPRKTFSMGHASEKRYYLESRLIR